MMTTKYGQWVMINTLCLFVFVLGKEGEPYAIQSKVHASGTKANKYS